MVCSWRHTLLPHGDKFVTVTKRHAGLIGMSTRRVEALGASALVAEAMRHGGLNPPRHQSLTHRWVCAGLSRYRSSAKHSETLARAPAPVGQDRGAVVVVAEWQPAAV